MPLPTSTGTLSKAKTALVSLSLAMAMLLLLCTFYMQVKRSSTSPLLIVAYIIFLLLVVIYQHNPEQTTHPPLFSFPSLSRQPRYNHFAVNSADLKEPAVAVNLPPVVPQHLKIDTVYDSRSTDGVVWERGKLPERISAEYRERNTSNLSDDWADDDQGLLEF
jgi:hypothetical protein